MALTYIHLSDIHFGQEKGSQLYVNRDAKDQLIHDARSEVMKLSGQKADGIIVSGDIAYSGKKEEYEEAGAWLDRLAGAVGCDRTDVQVVPGNHDIDRDFISHGVQLMINDIIEKGDTALSKYLESPMDSESLYCRFASYRTFAAAYNCPLDGEGAIVNLRTFEIAPGVNLKFHGINTALICSKTREEQGKLLLGQKQRVIPNEPGTEVVVIAHHPMHWLQDSDDALRYVENRARVFLSGHEHQPSHRLQMISDSVDLLSIASGATVPPEVNDSFTYCYNILQFMWDSEPSSLKILINPRIWIDSKKAFEKDTKNFGEAQYSYNLRCRSKARDNPREEFFPQRTTVELPADKNIKCVISAQATGEMENNKEQIILLRFFRDLSSSQRLSILIDMKALPQDFPQPMTHAMETMALKKIFSEGRTSELDEIINKFQAS